MRTTSAAAPVKRRNKAAAVEPEVSEAELLAGLEAEADDA
jgi:hypothetical protein